VFFETHPDPDRALSDAANQIPLDALPQLIRRLTALRGTLAESES
jgi:2-dehydro-3-deoxyphosphooctonate aldolase (KDO 8-P synthase)